MQVEYIGYVTPYGEHHRYYIIRYYLPYLQHQAPSSLEREPDAFFTRNNFHVGSVHRDTAQQ